MYNTEIDLSLGLDLGLGLAFGQLKLLRINVIL